ncbi:MAG: hypothetical protein Q4A24_01390 [Akkermansia sp.]|nr:hypothetical protein [Akkermansia sp.]
MAVNSTSKQRNNSRTLRLIVFVLLVGMCVFKLFVSYRGLNQPEAMDQAQIARSFANGEGFKTNFYRPVELSNAYSLSDRSGVDLTAFRDTNHAPLNIVSMAVALKASGYDNFEAKKMPVDANGRPTEYLYDADRVISATSCCYFALAMVLAYLLIARLFDDVVASSTILCLLLSDLMLDYSISGLAQPLMMCCLFGALHAVVSAVSANENGERHWVMAYMGVAFVMITLMVLSGWLSMWLAIGFLIFAASYFRPYGSYALAGGVILLLGVSVSLWNNSNACGSAFGNAFYGFYNSFGSGMEGVLRTTNVTNESLNSSNLVLRFFGLMFAQFKSLYVNTGSVIVAPFFFLALFNKFKRNQVQAIKWATLSMWIFACMGMALYGVQAPLSSGQLAILFAPLFVAYGFSLTFNFLARLNVQGITFRQARGLTIILVILIGSGSLVANLPKDLYMGIWLGDKGRPHYPPYYPPALNITLADATNATDVIATDQPWAVAWYANRRALWLPRRIDDYQFLSTEVFPKSGIAIQGIVITPSSYAPIIPSAYAPSEDDRHGRAGGINSVEREMGDFAPLAITWPLLLMDPNNDVFVNHFAPRPGMDTESAEARAQIARRRLGEIVLVSTGGTNAQFDEIVPLASGAAVLYRKRATAAQPTMGL